MEWINDVCCCLIFVDPVAAASGLHALLTDPSFFTSLGPALSRLEDIYTEPDTADLQLVATPKPAHGLQGSTPAWIRFALLQDRKSRNARDESRFYAEQRAHQHHDHRPPPARATQDLDAELEAYTAGEDSGSRRREDHARRRGGRRHSPRGDRDVELDRLDRFDGRHQTAHARQSGLAALDAELDSYLGQESPTASTSQQHSSATTPIELFPSLSGFRSDALAQGTHPVNSSFSSPTGLAPEQQQRSLFSRISPESVSSSSLPQPSGKPDLFGDSTNAAQRARPKAADLFSDQGKSAQSSGSGGMRGWDD